MEDKREIKLVIDKQVFFDLKHLTFAKGLGGNEDLMLLAWKKILDYVQEDKPEVTLEYRKKEKQ